MVLEKERKKKTRIVCTIGPASEDKKVLTKLVQAGMNVMRLNFSHGDFEEHGGRIKTLREINKELNKNVAILLDTKGPEIRTGDFVGGKTEFIAVPTEAVVPEMDGKRMWIVKNGKALSVPVETESRDEKNVEVTSGISVGDTILTGGLMQLRDGMAVEVKMKR